MSEITGKVKDGNLIITMPFDKKGTASGSGKSMVHATTSGNIELKVEGFEKPLKVGINVYTPKKD